MVDVVFVLARAVWAETGAPATAPQRRALLAARREGLRRFVARATAGSSERSSSNRACPAAHCFFEALGAVMLPPQLAIALEQRGCGHILRTGATALGLAGAGAGASHEYWHLDAIGARCAAHAGRGVIVGIADSWVDPVPGHFELPAGRVRAFGPGGQPSTPVPLPTLHGTAVASLIASRQIGVAPASTLAAASVLRQRDRRAFYGTPRQIAAGLHWLASTAFDGAMVKVVNASFTTTDDPALRVAIAHYVKCGVVLVASAGNSRGQVGYPAAYPDVVSVGSLDRHGEPAASSGRSLTDPDIWAPGSGVSAVVGDGVPMRAAGTSMAAPLVTGAIARVLGARPEWSGRQAADALLEAAPIDRSGCRQLRVEG